MFVKRDQSHIPTGVILQLCFGNGSSICLSCQPCPSLLFICISEPDQVKLRECSAEETESEWDAWSGVDCQRTNFANGHIIRIESQWNCYTNIHRNETFASKMNWNTKTFTCNDRIPSNSYQTSFYKFETLLQTTWLSLPYLQGKLTVAQELPVG